MGETNRLLCEDNRTELFVTLFYAVLDLSTGELEFANGGHNAPFLFSSDGEVGLLPVEEAVGTVVGVVPGVSYSTARARLRPGQGLLLYTDGVTEARAWDDRMFAEAGLEQYLRKACAEPAESIVAGLLDEVGVFAIDTPQSDDLTALAVRYIEAR